MCAVKSLTALHRLLGLPPGSLTSEMVDDAIAQGTAEGTDLDFKVELPPASNLPQTDFPKDVAAMANSGGGTIVYGIEEDQKRAVGRRDVGELSENYERTLPTPTRSRPVRPRSGTP
jgi:Schlafen, AlbA_2